jgi:hypothetical protein
LILADFCGERLHVRSGFGDGIREAVVLLSALVHLAFKGGAPLRRI